jgi:methyl-accepting chemotaxis protein
VEKQNAVTLEISRTVEESSIASREVAARIVNVSNEAIETGKRAAEIRDGAAEIARKIDGLQITLVRVVRTSTADADRRASSRIDIDGHGTLDIRGTSHKVRLRNISEGGALLGGAMPDVGINTPITLAIDGISVKLNGAVVSQKKDAISIKFNLSEDDKNAVERLIVGRRAA